MKTFKMILFFMVFGLTTNAQNIDLQKGLVGYWPFNGNANDESGFGNNGNVQGAMLVSDRKGNKNCAYSFNGSSSKIIVSNSNSLNISSNEMTISYWMYWKNDINDANYIGISKGGVDKYSGYELVLRGGYRGDNGYFSFSMGNKTLNFANSTKYRNQWVHLLGTFFNGTAKLYINGTCVETVTLNTTSTIKSSNNLYIGSRDPSNNWVGTLNGYIDDVRIYSRSLNSSEVQELYKNDINVISENSNTGNNAYDKLNNQIQSSKNIDKKEVNLLIPFNKIFLDIEESDLSKYEVSIVKKQAKKGDLASLVTYGDMFYYGYDKIERDEVEAIINYKKAADLGNALAQYKLATIYRQNTATVSDAIKYYNMAVEQNYEPAVYDLAILYLNGSGGISKDYLKAKELLQKIPSNMNAKTELGKLYLSSDISTFNLKADLQIAKSLFQDANQIGIFNEWLNRLDNFGKFRYALSKMPTLINGINTEIDFKNETQLKALIDQLNVQSELLGNEKINKYTYDLIDNLEVVNSTISKQYEDENYQASIKSKSPAKLKAFVNRFPNSTYRKSALDEITNLDNEKFKQAKSNNTGYSYEQYLDLFPLGLNADEARSKIKQIEQEEKLALEKQQEEERQAKIKAQQDEINAKIQREEMRKDRIINAKVGDRLCFVQGWTYTLHDPGFFGLFSSTKTTNYTMSIICFIENINGENYQIRIADVSSNNNDRYSSPNINGVKVNKGDVIWIKPINNPEWYRCD